MLLYLDLDLNTLVQAIGSPSEMDSISAKRASNGVVAIKVIQNRATAEAEVTDLDLKFVAKDTNQFDNVPLAQTTAFVWNTDREQYEAPINWNTPTLNERFGAQGDAIAITGTHSTDLFSATGHGLTAGQKVHFTTLSGGAGITEGDEGEYYVIASGLTADAFKVSATLGGSSIDFTSDIASGYVVPDEDDVASITLAIEVGWKCDSGDPWTPTENAVALTLNNNYIRDDDGAPEDPAGSVSDDWFDDRGVRHDEIMSPALSQNSRTTHLENGQPLINALTGGAAGALDSIPTASSAMTTGRWVLAIVSGELSIWQLQAGTTAEDSANGIVRPDDYDGSTNARIWIKVL